MHLYKLMWGIARPTTSPSSLGGGAVQELLTAGLARSLERVWGPLPRAEMDEELESEVARLAPEFLKEEWLYKIDRRMEGRSDLPLSS